MFKALIEISTGYFVDGPFTGEPIIPFLEDETVDLSFKIVTTNGIADARIQKWDDINKKIIPKTQTEIDNYDDEKNLLEFDDNDMIQSIITILAPTQKMAIENEFKKRKRNKE